MTKTNSIDEDIQEQLHYFDKVKGIESKNKCTYVLEFPNHIVDIKANITIRKKVKLQ